MRQVSKGPLGFHGAAPAAPRVGTLTELTRRRAEAQEAGFLQELTRHAPRVVLEAWHDAVGAKGEVRR